MSPPEAFYLGSAGHRRLHLLHQPTGECRGGVLVAPPFAEEMNKCRRMIYLAGRALAAEGWAVLVPDLFGCGDSDGDFVDASWSGWLNDLDESRVWLEQRLDRPVAAWLGVRAGALLAAPLLRADESLVGWQPVASGQQMMTQFLRLKVVGDAIGANAERSGVSALRAASAAGESIEVAGYRLSPGLLAEMDRARLEIPAGHGGRVIWLEVSSRADAGLSPAGTSQLARWSAIGIPVEGACVEGPQFWQSTEVTVAPRLLGATVDAISAKAVA